VPALFQPRLEFLNRPSPRSPNGSSASPSVSGDVEGARNDTVVRVAWADVPGAAVFYHVFFRSLKATGDAEFRCLTADEGAWVGIFARARACVCPCACVHAPGH
jgi:hypothetical protein